MTPEIKSQINKRQNLFSSGLVAEWKKARTKVRILIHKRKVDYHRELSTGDKNTWREINKLRRLHKTNANINYPELASTLNNEFYSVWNSSNQPDISKFILNKPDPSTPLLFTPAIINNSLKQINSSTPGPDGLKPQLKCIRLEIAEIVSTLFNQSLFYSFVPSQWKESNIVPISKRQQLLPPNFTYIYSL